MTTHKKNNFFDNCSFVKGVANIEGLEFSDIPEIAFLGRSNVGKSSLLNAITKKSKLAHTSKTPGRTQLINFFMLADEKRLVDLPGYGFALVSRSKKNHWKKILSQYFEERNTLMGIFLIVDIRRGITNYDLDMLFLSKIHEISVHILLTKSDKLKRGPAQKRLLELKSSLDKSVSIQLFSSLNRQGVDEARTVLDKFLDS